MQQTNDHVFPKKSYCHCHLGRLHLSLSLAARCLSRVPRLSPTWRVDPNAARPQRRNEIQRLQRPPISFTMQILRQVAYATAAIAHHTEIAITSFTGTSHQANHDSRRSSTPKRPCWRRSGRRSTNQGSAKRHATAESIQPARAICTSAFATKPTPGPV